MKEGNQEMKQMMEILMVKMMKMIKNEMYMMVHKKMLLDMEKEFKKSDSESNPKYDNED